MPRKARIDRPGLLHHLMNRGLARRTVFETRADARAFLALLARAVRAGRIEVHAYSLLTTHYHLLVRSLNGDLSEVMRRIQNSYVRRFNRSRRRDGALFRGRFGSRPVEDEPYIHTLIRYIDRNAVQAGLVSRPEEHPQGSARHHAAGCARPRWLARGLVDSYLAPLLSQGVPRPLAYSRVFAPSLSPAQCARVEGPVRAGVDRDDETESLLSLATGDILSWMRRKAALGDGTRAGLPVVDPASVAPIVDQQRMRAPSSRVAIGKRRTRSTWDLVQVALLRDLCSESFASIGRRLRVPTPSVRRLYDEHRASIDEADGYAGIVAEMARRALHARSGVAVAATGSTPDEARVGVVSPNWEKGV